MLILTLHTKQQVIKNAKKNKNNKVLRDCYLYNYIKLHLKLPMRADLLSNKTDNSNYKQLTDRIVLSTV